MEVIHKAGVALKTKGQTSPARSFSCSKSVFVILLIENILDRPIQPQRHLFLFKAKSISARQVDFAVSLKAVEAAREKRIAEYRAEVRRCRQKIKIYPRTFYPLGRDKRKLMIRHTQRIQHTAARKLRCPLVAVSVGI